MCVLSQDKKASVAKVQASRISPKGFESEEAMLDSIAQSCRGKRSVMLTGNYVVREGPNIEQEDPRLLGEGMLLTVELCARTYRKCVGTGIEPPTLLLVPNDLVPETFASFEEERAFKSAYSIPDEIRAILAATGISQEPVYFFNRDFERAEQETAREFASIRKRISEGAEKLIVLFESFAQNLATRDIGRGKVKHVEDIEIEPSGRRKAIIPSAIVDTFSRQPQLSPIAITITNPNGAPYCSFLAATLFRQFERLGFDQMINSFVKEEHPCADKAAAAYKYLYEGKMSIRNIYMDGASVVVDITAV